VEGTDYIGLGPRIKGFSTDRAKANVRLPAAFAQGPERLARLCARPRRTLAASTTSIANFRGLWR
jgi:hypothetical protein